MVLLALSLTVWPISSMPGFFIIVLRCNTSQELRNFKENWWRNAHFSTVRFIKLLDNLSTQYSKIVCLSYRYTTNILITEITTGNPSVISCWDKELETVFFLFYFQSLALGSKRTQIRKTIFIVLITSFTTNEYIPIAIESQFIVWALK